MSDIVILWKKITRGLKARRYTDDRAPTIDEISKIVEYPDRSIRTIACIMTSSGIRLGAWNYLKWRHVVLVRKNKEVTNLIASSTTVALVRTSSFIA